MSAEGAREFVDANIPVYAYDASAGKKKIAADQLPVVEAAERVREFAAWRVFAPVAGDILRAIELHKQTKLSFWDAMIVHAAAEMACDVLWTEDLNDGQVISGVRIRDPFAQKRR